MTNKPLITQEKYEAIREAIYLHGENYVVDQHCLKQKNNVLWCGTLDPLNDIEMWVLAKCVYTSDYEVEVEPEYEEGQYVKRKNGKIGRIVWLSRDKNITSIEWTEEKSLESIDSIERHATEQEIQQEKERRFFSRNGRTKWQLKQGDLLYHSSIGYFEIVWDSDVEFGDGCMNYIKTLNQSAQRVASTILTECRVVCFVEKRTDQLKTLH